MIMVNNDKLEEKLRDALLSLKTVEDQLDSCLRSNEVLKEQVKNLTDELHLCKSSAHNKLHVSCQVSYNDIIEECGDKPFPQWDHGGVSLCVKADGEGQDAFETSQKRENLCITESLREAAEEEMYKESGYTYDVSSGYYYNSTSGLYYDSVRQLFYDQQTLAYYRYDGQAKSFQFSSYAYRPDNNIDQTLGQQMPPSTEASHLATSARLKDGCRRRLKKITTERHKCGGESRSVGHSLRKSSNSTTLMETGNAPDTSQCSPVDNEMEDDLGDGNCSADGNNMPEDSCSLCTDESELMSDRESGEVDDQSSESSQESQDVSLRTQPGIVQSSDFCDIETSANYPPCIRVIVQASDVLDMGTFFMITCTGGTVGRDKDAFHVVHIPDVNLSKIHAEIMYDHNAACYTVQDLGSQNGTFLNDLRLSQSKERSGAVPLHHGDHLHMGSTHMLLHIHPRSDTCDDCEPGQVLAALRVQKAVNSGHCVNSKFEKKDQLWGQLKMMKKKYGLSNSAYMDNVEAINNPNYEDKAMIRRRLQGSDHPVSLETSQVSACVHWPISATNKGHCMLSKMGWTEGNGLGKDGTGRCEPVIVQLRANQTAGLGSSAGVCISIDNAGAVKRAMMLQRTRERYHRSERQSDCSRGFVAGTTDGPWSRCCAEYVFESKGAPSSSSLPSQIMFVSGGIQNPS